MKYRHTPSIVEAFVYEGDLWCPLTPEWALEAYLKGRLYYTSRFIGNYPVDLCLLSSSGINYVEVGDYTIQGSDGQLYSCSSELFKTLYEPFDD